MIEIFTLIGVFSILLYTTLYKKEEPEQEQFNNEFSKLSNKLNEIEKGISETEELIKGNQLQNLKEQSKQNKKLDTYTTAMNRLILLYEDLSNSPKPTKKAETESEKVEKITDKLFDELEELNLSAKKGSKLSTKHN